MSILRRLAMNRVLVGSARRPSTRLAPVIGAMLLFLACAPSSPSIGRSDDGAASARRTAKLLVMGRYNTNEPKAGIVPFGPGGSAGQADFPFIFHAGLTTYDPG